MAELRALLSERKTEPDATDGETFEAIIAEDADDLDVMIRVLVPSISATRWFGPCPWTARPDIGGYAIPSAGDRALVARTTENSWWIVAWWPS